LIYGATERNQATKSGEEWAAVAGMAVG